jgi:hypothetical protein
MDFTFEDQSTKGCLRYMFKIGVHPHVTDLVFFGSLQIYYLLLGLNMDFKGLFIIIFSLSRQRHPFSTSLIGPNAPYARERSMIHSYSLQKF